MRMCTLVRFTNFIILGVLIVALSDLSSVYANNIDHNQCANLFEVQKPSFAKFISQKVKLLQDEQNKNIEPQRLTEERVKEVERQREELFQALDPVTHARKIQFITIKPRKFRMGTGRKAVKVHITKPYDIMDTKMTQMMYAQLMLLLGIEATELIFPSQFKDGRNSIQYIHNKSEIPMRPNDPVTKVSWDDIHELLLPKLNKLSESDDASIQSLLKKTIPDHQKGDVYDFVTEAQIENVMKLAKTADGDTIDAMIKRGDHEKLKKYVAYDQNWIFGTGTYPEASLLPLFIDGKPIYLHGNVWEWTKDHCHWVAEAPLIGGQDTLGTEGSCRSLRGGCSVSIAEDLLSAKRIPAGPEVRYTISGFRLARVSRGSIHTNLGGTP